LFKVGIPKKRPMKKNGKKNNLFLKIKNILIDYENLEIKKFQMVSNINSMEKL